MSAFGVKRTSLPHRKMSAYDPKRRWRPRSIGRAASSKLAAPLASGLFVCYTNKIIEGTVYGEGWR